MENRLKERLTGAAILVALIVLLVPEMFHGQRGEVAPNAGSSGEGPPLRSYTIDLSNSPTRSAPLQSSANGTAEPATPPAPDSASAQAPAAAPPAGPAQEAAPAAPMAAAPAAERAAPAAERTAPGEHAVAAARAAAAEHAPAPNWSVQLGLFAQRENAERLLHAAETKGFAVSLSDPDGKGLYRVRSSALMDRATAQELEQRLRAAGFPAAIVPP